METIAVPGVDKMLMDKDALRRMLDEADARSGFVHDPTATPVKAREMMRAQGVRPRITCFPVTLSGCAS